MENKFKICIDQLYVHNTILTIMVILLHDINIDNEDMTRAGSIMRYLHYSCEVLMYGGWS